MSTAHKLNLTYYPYTSHLLEHYLKPICSEHGGITQSLLMSPIKQGEDLFIKSVVAQMPGYHRVLLSPHLEMQYHLSGYGTFYEEALIRLVGEAIERYSLMVAQRLVQDRILYAPYSEIKKNGTVVPFEYLRLFNEADYEKLNRGTYSGIRKLGEDDIVGWLQCPSLFEPNLEIWVPAQMLFVGYKLNRQRGEIAFAPGFSTGTAAHLSLDKALQNAILELIEIDALMLRWYANLAAPAVVVDEPSLTALVPKLLGADSRYETLMLDLSILEGVDAHVFSSIIINKKHERPYITLGAQGHLDPLRAAYRSLMEAIAIAFLGIYGPLYMPREYLASESEASFTDLDSNVAFFASPKDAAKKRAVIDKLVAGKHPLSAMKNHNSGAVGTDTARLVRQLTSISRYGVYLDVTPPETSDRGWNVVRVFMPELVTMCVPGAPYSLHPRFAKYGGIRNEYPHPLP